MLEKIKKKLDNRLEKYYQPIAINLTGENQLTID